MEETRIVQPKAPRSTEIKFSVKNMDLYYGDFLALKNVNIDINRNAVTAFIGPSGCGKSTLAKALISLEPAKSGEIIFEDKNILSFSKKDLKEFRKHAQMIFQNPYASLNPKMKIFDILKEPLEINTNFSKQEIK